MKKKLFSLLFLAIGIAACSSSDDNVTPETPSTTSFDRAGMLRNLADNLIIPAYQELNVNLGVLVAAKNNFITLPTPQTLETLRATWLVNYKSWQHVEMFNIGKAEEIQYSFQMNIYPVNTTDVENNISSGSYDLTHPNNNDAVGFPALDYLLHGIGATDAEILEKYTTNAASATYKTYLSDLVDQMQLLTQEVLNDWTTSYRSTFISSTANTATSATNKFINDFIFYYEKGLRATKIGIPAGNFSATTLPEKVEAFYNQQVSKELALEALTAVQNVFNGIQFNGSASGESFKTYLISLDRTELANFINAQFNTSHERIQALNANFYAQINTDNTKMTQAYDALQAGVVLLKVDMLQAFNVSVDYVDADGD